MSLRPHCIRANDSGASAVEFALVLPVFLLIAMGTVVYGIYFGAANSAAQLAADAARASVAGLNDAERASIARQHVAASAGAYMLIDATKVAVEAAPLASDTTQFRVAIRYDSAELPIWGLAGIVPLPAKIIERTATIKRGGF